MKLVTYIGRAGKQLPGVLLSENIILNIEESARKSRLHRDLTSVRELLEAEDGLEWLERLLAEADIQVTEKRSDCQLLAPVMNPEKILGVALNYKDFCVKGGLEFPKTLKVFGKYPSAVNPTGGEFCLWGRKVTYEGELGVVIGKTCRNVRAGDAGDYIAGYTVVNDISANDRIKEDVQLFRGKNMDGALPMGPVLVTKDEIQDPMKLSIATWVDGVKVQDSSTDQMIFDIYQQVEYFSEFMTLKPGDVIATGTPAGTALQHEPPCFLKKGQRVAVEIESIGRIETRIV